MAQLVALAGAGVGFLIGGPLGAQIGAAVGETLGGVLFPAKQPDGPRLGDLTIQSAAMGAPIALSAGTMRLAGQIIDSTEIKETPGHTGGKGGALGGGGQTVYSYSVTMAISFGRGLLGPAKDVLRMWGDGKLFYDKTGTALVSLPGLKFKFYPGDEAQLPDPSLEALHGAGNVSAYRDQSYIVFTDLPLANFGNHPPNITAEFAFSSTSPVQHEVVLTGTSLSSYYGNNALAVNWQTRQAISRVHSGVHAGQFGAFAVDSMTQGLTRDWADLPSPHEYQTQGFGGDLVFGPDGYLYTGISGAGLAKLDAATLQELARDATNQVARIGFLQLISNTEGARKTYAYVNAIFGSGHDAIVETGGFAVVWQSGSRTSSYAVAGFAAEKLLQGSGTGLLVDHEAGVYSLSRVTVLDGAVWDAINSVSLGVQIDLLHTFTAAECYGSSTSSLTVDLAIVDPADGRLVIGGSTTAGPWLMKWDQDASAAVWRCHPPTIPAGTGISYAPNSDFSQGTLAWIDDSSLTLNNLSTLVDLADGTFVNQSWAVHPLARTDQVYDSQSNSLIVYDNTNSTYVRIYLGRAQGAGADLGDIVTAIAGLVGLAPEDLDVSELTDTVWAYSLGRPMTAAQALAPLSAAYFFDAVESDYLAKFPKRPQTKSVTIPEDDLGLVDAATGRVVKETRTQELEIPASCTVAYIDKDADYQQGSKTWRRPIAPRATMRSSNNLSIQLGGIAMSGDDGIRIAQKALYQAWLERDPYAMVLPWTYLALDPADVIGIAFDDGSGADMRLSKTDLGVDYSIAADALSEDGVAYSSTASGGESQFVPQTVPGPGLTKTIVFDLPLLRDVDSLGAGASRAYWAAGPLYETRWPGCRLLESADNVSYAQVGAASTAMAWGTVATALPDNPEPWTWDTVTALKVYPAVGADAIESSTDLEVLNGANAMAIVRADGEAEVIQFVDAVANSDGSISISRLLRGRRGTDIFCAGHGLAETYVLLTRGTINGLAVALTDRGLTRYWKGLGSGQTQSSTPTEIEATNARDLMPYAPVHIAAALSGGDALLSWVRRTRIGGEWVDGGDVPLSEASEAYEVDVMSGPAGTVKRTLSGLGTPAATYTAAQATTDFGSMPASLTLQIFQKSAPVGRGMTRETTVPVT